VTGVQTCALPILENSIEPYLIREKFVIRTPKGRVIGNKK
jgi:Holliday junction resolvasome RuvABC ATP-dependent DNA helicase subunit